MEFNLIKSKEVPGLRQEWLLIAIHSNNPTFSSFGLFPDISIEDSEDGTPGKIEALLLIAAVINSFCNIIAIHQYFPQD
jgi:hypothetical protein